MLQQLLKITPKHTSKNILILGFYDRNNTGDEMYKEIFNHLLKGHKLTYACTDEIVQIPSNTDIIICGGGEIINEYFMTKINALVRHFSGQIYAISVNLSGEIDAQYLHLFDHVYMRNKTDYLLAKATIGERNCTYLPDITHLLPNISPTKSTRKTSKQCINIGISLAQPVFYQKPMLLAKLTKVLMTLLEDDCNIKLHFFNFNNHLANKKECDIYLNEEIVSSFPKFIKQRCQIIYDSRPLDIYRKIGEMDFNICMRFHSVIFSLIQKVPFISLYKSRKVDLLLNDLELSASNMRFENDIDSDVFYHKLKIQLVSRKNVLKDEFYPYFNIVIEHIDGHKQKNILMNSNYPLFSKVYENALSILENFLQNKITSLGPLPLGKKNPLEVAQLICHVVTGDTSHPCLWGLKDNISKPNFNFKEAINYIYDFQQQRLPPTNTYYPVLKPQRTCLLIVDPVYNNKFEGLHRSGWNFVINGMMNLDAGHLGRRSDLIVDTYVDRTFHWGEDVALAMGSIPYNKPWIGFIHHTFDDSQSEHNCQTLFSNPNFLSSLMTCKSLITMSHYLADKVKEALDKKEYNIPVKVLYHPTEFVKTLFTLEKFYSNDNKRLVQIGAWLRNPYAIYQLPLDSKFKNPLGLTKAVLKGKEMSSYFKPLNLFENLEELLNQHVKKMNNSISRHNGGKNKYTTALVNALVAHDTSVDIIDYLANDEYDELLSQNIVFLDLIDCSAVNTVIECIARNTPLIVNRHPALTELLGESYPGFYDSYLEAVHIATSEKKLKKIYTYLFNMDKTKIRLDTFLIGLMSIVNSL